MITTKLNLHDKLPLTCSRTGTCCHGKLVLINPWELVCLARKKKITPSEFRDLYCEDGGIRLRFDGKAGWKQQKACSQYIDNFGCSVHMGRPLACRLYPLGRQTQSEEVQYIYQGEEFPCLEGCPEVTGLPQLSVGEYLNGQSTSKFEKAQDAYLDLMQNLADVAFMLLLDTGLAQSGDKKTLSLWRKMGNESPETLAARIGQEWLDSLMFPEISEDLDNPISFVQKHSDLLQLKVQEKFGTLETHQQLHDASVLIMGVALHLARGVGANPEMLAEHWIATAKSHGALE
ncbi:MAG: zinc/iron-chelating domain-containing protein [Bacteroidetes bacterium HGW-Bacteroidetes-21]|nr:MAG: zinc/iron-chelating domain-containing protein [Bacteroidetes bacterium HGW-Bacteroidetes-21]